VIDTSGSMGEAEIASALAEVTGVLREVGVRGNRVTVLACDADVQAVSRVTAAEQVTLSGGGGNDMRVTIAAALAGHERPDAIACLTDSHTPRLGGTPACRLVAALMGPSAPAAPPWVETVRVTG